LLYDRSNLEAIYLPVGQMLQLDRVSSITGNRLVCEMDLDNHWVFNLHFPSDPIFPGSLLIEAAGQAAAVWAWHEGLRGRPRMLRVSAEFRNPVGPGDGLVRLTAVTQRRRNICRSTVQISVGARFIAEIKPMIMVLPG
jgi:3-hydroxyacyl-[acyl-carrier-protein] dehydratase